jgi:predicted dienelactone hydrolase
MRIFKTMFRLFILAVGKTAGFLFPIRSLPTPGGKYAVGTTSFAFTDHSRVETFASAPNNKRSVYVQVWYPAGSTENFQRTHIWVAPEKVIPLITNATNAPAYLFSQLARGETNSHLDAPLSNEEAAYPILVFSHGYYFGFPAQNTVQMEELASHGYIVFSIGHAYESIIVLDDQGRAIPINETHVNTFLRESGKNAPLIEQFKSASETERLRIVRAFLDNSPLAQQSVQIWTQDTQFVLTQIERMNRGEVDSSFAGKLDMARIGVFGMSFGGATAVQVCAVDPRCKAAVNMDGFQFGTMMEHRLNVPFMMMYSETAPGMNDFVLDRMTACGYRLKVANSQHLNYTDFNLVGSLFKSLKALGTIDSGKMERIMNSYLLAFFDQTLKGIPSPLLQGANPDYPEVELRIFNASPV